MIANDTLLHGRYRVERLLARGGMSDVFVARDERLRRPVAIKVMRGSDPVERRRFRRETRLLAGLTHPNLVRVYDAGEADGDIFVVLELVEGRSLADELAGGVLDPSDVAVLGAAMADALAYIHHRGVVHRDVKPSNILVADDGRVLLGDFGIARLVDDSRLTATDTTIGTAAYMAPEQVRGSTVTAAADVYSLGLVLLETLTGHPAFSGPAPEAAIARVARDPELPDTLPSGWPGLLRSMTDRHPEARPAAASLPARIRATQHVETSTGQIETTPPTRVLAVRLATAQATAAPRRGPIRLVTGAVAALLLVAGGLALMTRGIGDPERDTTTTAPPSSTLAPADPAPVLPAPPASSVPEARVDCAALEGQRRALDDRKREIARDYRHDPETRRRLTSEIDDQRRALDDQLRDHCR